MLGWRTASRGPGRAHRHDATAEAVANLHDARRLRRNLRRE
jgi:hypothetical protein